jgi:TP901 family phage tail tape measure protein
MTNVGEIHVIVSANTKKLTTALAAATKQLRSFGAVSGRVGPAMAQNYQRSFATIGQAASKNQTTLDRFGMSTQKVAHTSQSSMGAIGRSGQQMSRVLTQSVNQAHGSFNTFSDFIDKIRHYIVFSIGVQMVMAVRRAFDYIVNAFMEFEYQAIRTAAVTGRLDASFDKVVGKLQEVTKELARTSFFLATDVVKSMYDFASAGFKVADMVDNVTDGVAMMRPVIDYATGQQIELTQSTELVATALKMFRLGLDSTKRVVDVFTAAIANSFLTNEKLADSLTHVGAIAHEMGLQLEETIATLMAVMDAGYRAGSAGQALRMMLLRLVDPTDKSERALQRLGLTMQDIDPEMHSFIDILYKLQAANFGVAEASQMFRARTAGVVSSLVRSADEVARYNRVLYASEGITEKVARASEESFAGALKLVKAQLDVIAVGIGERLAPIIESLGSYLTDVLLPSLSIVASIFDMIGAAVSKLANALSPLRPIWDGLVTSLTVLIGLFITFKLLLLAAAVRTAIYSKAVAISTIIEKSHTAALFRKSIGLTRANMGLVAYTKMLLVNTKATFLSTKATYGLTAALLACPLTWFAVAIGAVIGVLYAFSKRTEEAKKEQEEYNEKIREFNETFNKYRESIDVVRRTLGDYLSVQKEISQLIEAGKAHTSEYTDALARQQNITNQLKDDEREFLSHSEKVLNNIADKSVEVAEYVNEARKANVAELEAIGLAERYVRTTEWIIEAEKTRIELESVKTEQAEDYQAALNDEIKLKQSLMTIEKDLTGVTGNLTEEIVRQSLETGNLTELTHDKGSAIDKAKDAMQDADSMLKTLTGTNLQYAKAVRDILNVQNQYMDLMSDLQKAQSRLNLLTSARQNIEDTMLGIIKDLTSSQLKLYDIELRIYKLRHSQVNVVRDLFGALADQGALTTEIIDAYRLMEQTQGQSLKTHVDYTKALDDLSGDQRSAVMDWTKVYIESLGKGLSSTEAFLRANEIMGYELQEIEGVSESAANAVLAYAHAEHDARYAASELEKILKEYVGAMVDADQASLETVQHYYDMIRATREIANENVELEKTQREANQTLEAMAESIAKLAWYFIETSDDAESFKDVLGDVIQALGLTNRIGSEQADILESLNTFYDRTLQSLDEYNDSEILAFLAGHKLNMVIGDTATLITDVRTSTEPTIDTINELTQAASLLREEIFRTHPGLESLIDYLNTLEITEYTWMDAIGDMPIAEWDFFEQTSKRVLDNISSWASGAAQDIRDLESRLAGLSGLVGDIQRDLPKETPTQEYDWSKYWAKGFMERRTERDAAIMGRHGTGIGAAIIRGIDMAGQGLVEGVGAVFTEGTKALLGFDHKKILGGIFGFSKGGIVGDKVSALQRGIQRTTGPQLAMIGERGAEAVVPLEGINKKYGRNILSKIIPKHFPELSVPAMQRGFHGRIIKPLPQPRQPPFRPLPPISDPRQGHDTPSITIQGDINVYGVQNVEEFLDKLIKELEERRRMTL